jgi:hypothetical protein
LELLSRSRGPGPGGLLGEAQELSCLLMAVTFDVDQPHDRAIGWLELIEVSQVRRDRLVLCRGLHEPEPGTLPGSATSKRRGAEVEDHAPEVGLRVVEVAESVLVECSGEGLLN